MKARLKLFSWIIPLIGVVLLAVYFSGGFERESEPGRERTFIIGLITNNPNGMRNIEGFRDGLRGLGYVEGENVTFLFSGKPTPQDELGAAVEEMISNAAELVFTAGTPTGVAARAATRENAVPVVFGVIADPVKAGVMTDLNRPGGNMTGVMLSENQARRLELFLNFIPDTRRVLVPYNPEDAAPVSAAAQLEAAAAALGVALVHAHARNNDEASALLADFPSDVDAVFMLPDSTVNRRVADLIKRANQRKIPVSGPSAAQVEEGALMAYGIVHHEVGMQAARIADRILRGADPATLPVETADFYLTINVAAATRIGLDISEELLQQADLVLYEDALSQ